MVFMNRLAWQEYRTFVNTSNLFQNVAVSIFFKTRYVSHILSTHTVPLTIWYHLFLEFWLVNTWIFAHWRHQRTVTRLENERQLKIRRGKKLGFQLSEKHPIFTSSVVDYFGIWCVCNYSRLWWESLHHIIFSSF